jgi:hypothetical protein
MLIALLVLVFLFECRVVNRSGATHLEVNPFLLVQQFFVVSVAASES